MSKFKVGDKVVFNREKAKSDIDRLVPGADNWLDDVPKGPLTIKDAVGIDTLLVEECPFAFSSDWLDKYEEPVRVERFKIGDKVKVLKDRIGGDEFWTHFVDYDKTYTVGAVLTGGKAIALEDDRFGFVYSPNWLDKVEDGKCEVKVSEGRIKDVKFSGPATIVFWTDGTKTVVKCRKGDKFDPEKGIAMACAKKLLGNEDGYHREIAKYANVENSVEVEPPKDIEKLRRIVSASCFPLNCVAECPCRKLGLCSTIARAGRKELLLMYRAFQKAGKLRKEEGNA